MGAYLQLVTPGIPLLGAFLYHGVYDVPAYSFTCTGVFTNRTPTDAYRGAGRPEATYAIERSIDALAREGRHRSGRDPAPQLHPDRQVPVRVGSRVARSTRGNYEPALDRALEMRRLRRAARRSGSAGAPQGATKHLGIGLLELRRDVRPRAEPRARVVELRGRRMGGRDRAGPADRQGPGRHRDLAARSGSRDRVVDDRRREARHPDRGHRRAALRHRDRAARAGLLRLAVAVGRRHRGRHGDRSRCSRRPARSRRTSSRSPRTTSSSSTASSGRRAARRARWRSGALAFEAFTAHNLPDGMEPNLEGQISWDPPNFTFPFGVHVAVVEIDEETGQRRAAALHRRRRLRQPGEPVDRRRADPRGHRPGRRAGVVGGSRVRRRRQLR